MLPIFLAEAVPGNTILSIMGAKVVIGMVMGFVVDAVLRLARRDKERLRIHELCEQDQCGCNHDCHTCEQAPERVYEHHDDVEHTHEHGHGWKGILKSATKHTVQVTLFIFLITVVLNVVLETVGEDALAQFLGDNPSFSVFATALVGLIPNCAASVVIAQLYVEGVLGAGAMLAGLLVSAGVGLLVLARANRPWKQNVAIIVVLYATGVFWGLICNGLGVVFSGALPSTRFFWSSMGRRRWGWQAAGKSSSDFLPPTRHGSTSIATTASPDAPSQVTPSSIPAPPSTCSSSARSCGRLPVTSTCSSGTHLVSRPPSWTTWSAASPARGSPSCSPHPII